MLLLPIVPKLPSIALKRCVFSDHLNFTILTKFFIRSDFLAIYCNIAIKQQNNYGFIRKVCHLHYGIFHLIHPCYTLSILLYHLPSFIHKKINYGMREKKRLKNIKRPHFNQWLTNRLFLFRHKHLKALVKVSKLKCQALPTTKPRITHI